MNTYNILRTAFANISINDWMNANWANGVGDFLSTLLTVAFGVVGALYVGSAIVNGTKIGDADGTESKRLKKKVLKDGLVGAILIIFAASIGTLFLALKIIPDTFSASNAPPIGTLLLPDGITGDISLTTANIIPPLSLI